MNDDDIRTIDDAREGVGDRVLTARSARHDLDSLSGDKQRRRRTLDKLRWQRDHDIIDHVAVTKRVDAALENRAASQRQQLLWLVGSEAETTATGRDNGGYVQAR